MAKMSQENHKELELDSCSSILEWNVALSMDLAVMWAPKFHKLSSYCVVVLKYIHKLLDVSTWCLISPSCKSGPHLMTCF